MERKRQDSGLASQQFVEGQLTGRIIERVLTVHNALDIGMLESVYRKALVVELAHQGLDARQEVPIDVAYRGVEVGYFRLDVLVEGRIAVEIKATELLPPIAKRQLLNYLRVSRLDVGLLLHFGTTPKVHRPVAPRMSAGKHGEQILPLP